MTPPFWLMFTVIYGIAIVLLVITAIQRDLMKSIYLDTKTKHTMKEMSLPGGSNVGQTEGGGDWKGSKRSSNLVRSYAISCDMRASKNATDARRPIFRTDQMTMCEGNHFMNVQSFYFRQPFWLVVDITRSSRVLYDDILNGYTRHLLFDSHPCSVRTANKPEVERVSINLKKIREKRAFLLVIADDRDFTGDCAPPRSFSYGNQSSPEKFASLMAERAKTEQHSESKSSSTLMHVWGYSVTSATSA